MKNVFINFCIFVAFSFCISCTAKVSKFTVPSGANEPTIKQGATILVSQSREPKRFDFICFNNELAGMGKFVAVFRLCGMEGDAVEIKNGDLHVNGQLEDDQFNLMQLYSMPVSEFNRITGLINVNEGVPNQKGDSVQLFLSTAFVKEHSLKCNRKFLSKNQKDDDIARVFHSNWNPDQFGPVTVPQGYYFVLGDNRRHAADSRYLRFISKDKLIGTVILK